MNIDPATLTLADWEARRAALAPSVGMVSDGHVVAAASGDTDEDCAVRDGPTWHGSPHARDGDTSLNTTWIDLA